MSFPALGWALAQRAPSSGAKFVLTVLADAASVGDWLAWPSVQYLAETTQQDRKSVMANLFKLKEAGLIEPAGKKGKTGQVIVWRLPVGQPVKSPKSGTVEAPAIEGEQSQISAETVPNFPANSTAFPAEQYQKRDTEPVREPVREPVIEPGRERAKRATRSRRVPLPDDFGISDQVKAWAAEKGFDNLEAHLEAFVSKARAKAYLYANWDEAFMGAIRKDWAGLRQPSPATYQRKGRQLQEFGALDYSAGLENGNV